ncbi:MATE family efflux transporter [Chitinophaga horti]|uniref:Multidrug-efflux transporter n=1 Tax=Chitinophaga horti TaxID=2920382 RepID=A0ABY6IZI9_9BACT|nr:MATE family efflux transporter [Chitinophaga horti]UYQ92596.1 MATE family efflux transporter [Chitinophaga horti]
MQQVTGSTRKGNFFKLLKESIVGGEQEYTSGSIDRAIFLLAVPMVLEMVMESTFALVDIFFVGKLGKAAVASVGLTESVLTLVYSLAMGLSMASTAVVARRTGEKDPEGAAHAAMQAIYLMIGMSVLISLAGIFFADDILLLMGAGADVIREGHNYARIMLTGNAVIMLLFLINGIFRGAGNAAIAMKSLIIANVLNILLCPALIYGFGPLPALGLDGAAIGTTIGRGIGVLYQVWHLFIKKNGIHIAARHLGFDMAVVRRIIKIAAGGTAQFLIGSASWIFLIRIISIFGEEALAGYTIAIRMVIFTMLPAWGLANAAATLVGQNLGAKLPDRAEKSVWRAAFFNMIFLGLVSVVYMIGAPAMMTFFTQDDEVLRYGAQCLRLVTIAYIFYGYGMVIAQAFNGAGDTRTPTVINIFGFWCFQIPLAYVLAVPLGLGPAGVFIAISAAESAIALAGIIIFRKGRWKQVKV